MKRRTKTYIRSFYISTVIILCFVFGWLGIATAYKNTVQVAFGEYKKAIELTDEGLRILDFIIKK